MADLEDSKVTIRTFVAVLFIAITTTISSTVTYMKLLHQEEMLEIVYKELDKRVIKLELKIENNGQSKDHN